MHVDGATTVLMAFEPRAYRETIGEAVKELRPCLEVMIADPDDKFEARLDSADVVVCGRPEIPGWEAGLGWVEFRPYSKPAARIRVGGCRYELEEVGLQDILYVIDEARWFACTDESSPLDGSIDGSKDAEIVLM